MSKYLETLKQYHFDRDEFCSIFYGVFDNDESIDIQVMCNCHECSDEFIFYSDSDEYYIIHKLSGVVINWYKHIGRTNTCNVPEFTCDDLLEFFKRLRKDLEW